MSEAIEKAGGQVVALAADGWTRDRIDLVKRTVCPKGISDVEFSLFIEQCKRTGMDPLIKECFCVPRRTNVGTKEHPNWITRHEFQPGEVGFLRRAQEMPDFRGISASAVYSADAIEIDAGSGTVSHRFNPAKSRGQLLGAWARVERAGKLPVVVWLDLAAYQQNTANWRSMPATMIEKCARVGALRKCYPGQFGGLYLDEEPTNPGEVVSEAGAPDPAAMPRTAKEAKAQLAEAVATVNGAKAAWERIKTAGLGAGMSPDDITKESLRLAKKTKRAELTEADADAFVRWLEDAPTDAEFTEATSEAMAEASNPL